MIDQDGSPRGQKYFALWNPSPVGTDHLTLRGATEDAVWLMAAAMEAGAQTLAFTRTRQAAELVNRYVQDAFREQASPLAQQMRAYRGGYLPNERRGIEQDLFSGKLRGVAATNALELGIDVGSLDVALLVHYPGTFASVWQQAGRAGRRQGESLAVLIAANDPIDQFLMRNPSYFFAQSPEHAVVDPENAYVLAKHLQAAAFELPLAPPALRQFGDLAEPIAEVLCEDRRLSHVAGKYYSSAGQNPAQQISLRHMSDNTFSIVVRRDSGNEVLANVDAISAPELVYPEAVYLHDGQSYFVRELDLNGKVAYVERQEMDYYTQAILESSVRITGQRSTMGSGEPTSFAGGTPWSVASIARAAERACIGFGDVDVSWKTVAFKKIKFATRENIGYGPVNIPEQHLVTTALWLTPDDRVRAQLRRENLRTSEGVCGLRNLMIVALPLVAMCDSRDLGGVADSRNFGRSSAILYDRYPGGLGYCQKGYTHIDELLNICRDMVAQCPCETGCPSCVGLPNLRPAIHSDPDLTRGYPIPNKVATIRLLELLTSGSEMVDGTQRRGDGELNGGDAASEAKQAETDDCEKTPSHSASPCGSLVFLRVVASPRESLTMLSPFVLQRLSALNLTARAPAPPVVYHPSGEEKLDGCEADGPGGPHWRWERPVRSLWPALMSCWGPAAGRRTLDSDADNHPDLLALAHSFPQSAMFLDLETCGFAGCAIFLVGIVHWQQDELFLTQLFARHYGEEQAVLSGAVAIDDRQGRACHVQRQEF